MPARAPVRIQTSTRKARVKTGTLSVTSLHVQANRLDLLSRLADDLAHEIKNPIHAAVINLELLKRRIGSGEAEGALERVHRLEEEIARVHQLAEWLLQLLRPSREGPEPIDLDQLVSDMLPALEVLGKVSRVLVWYEPAEQGAAVAAPRAELRHALLNLVANALDAMRPGGGRLDLRGSCTAGEVGLLVRDSGPGVAEEVAERIGTPGYSTRPGRSGLGLAVARALIEGAGGRIELAPSGGTGEGAAFLLALPRTTGA